MNKKVLTALVLSLLLAMVLPFMMSADEPIGWETTDGYNWIYKDEDGVSVKNTVMWIEGECYGFGTDGYMLRGWAQPNKTEIWSDAAHKNAWYYFDASGKGVTGIMDGYLLQSGALCTDATKCSAIYYEGNFYAGDANGIAQQLFDGWNKVGSTWYYLENNQPVDGLLTLGDTRYYFYFGRMAANETIYQESVYCTADGVAHNPGWIYTPEGWMYYNDNWDVEKDTLLWIDNSYYYFDENGYMLTNTVYEEYRIKENGKLYSDEWYLLPSGEWTYYDGPCLVERGLRHIEGTPYYFEDGIMQTNTIYGNYLFDGSGKGTNFSYLPDAWYQDENDNWIYIQDGYLIEYGVYNLGGTDYAFSDGYLYTDGIFYDYYSSDIQKAYYVNDNGAVEKNAGWKLTDYGWLYINADATLHHGWLNLDGVWYYMLPSMAKNTSLLDGTKIYYFDSNGRYTEITSTEFYRFNSYTFYNINSGNLVDGWQNFDGNWFYFRNGYLVKDKMEMIGGSYYYFDPIGVMQTGWINDGWEGWKYADASGALVEGWHLFGNTWNYFSEFGDDDYDGDGYSDYAYGGNRYESEFLWDGDRQYLFDKNGAIAADTASASGWVLCDNNWYFAGNYGFYIGGTYEIDGAYYYFDYNGVMQSDTVISGYYYTSGGSRYTTEGWLNLDGNWYYVYENGQLANGICMIEYNRYCFENYVLQIGTFTYDYYTFTTTPGGAITSANDLSNGWHLITDNYGVGKYYYVKNHSFYCGWVGNYYSDGWGGMLCDGVATIDGNNYYLDENGLCAINTWVFLPDHSEDGEWVYAKADGSLYEDEWALIGGNWYYFDQVYMYKGGILEIDGKLHKFAENGVWLGETTKITYTEGWQIIDGKWVYAQNGSRLGYGVKKIDGTWYGFANGYLASNEFVDGYYIDANGVIVEYSGWQIINGNWVYFDLGHNASTGWFTVGGVKYYGYSVYNEDTDEINYKLATGYFAVGNYLAQFGAGGNFLGYVTENGWYKSDYDWYCVYNGKLCRDGIYLIDGTLYAFNYNGEMIANGVYDGYLFGANGALVTAEGWYLIDDGEWAYVDANGNLLKGHHYVGGVLYYFDFGYYYYY